MNWKPKHIRQGPRSKLATYGPRGAVHINPKVPKAMRPALRRHEKTEYKLRHKGMTYKQAHARALKAEHKGMTKKQISKYEGKLGAIARHG